MSIPVTQGSKKTITIRLTDQDTGDPINFADPSFEYELVCMKLADGTSLHKAYIPRTGTLSIGSPDVTGLDTTDLFEGCPVSGTGIPAGTKILYTPESASPNAQPAGQVKLTQNATAAGATALVFGDITILSPGQWGKFQFDIKKDESPNLPEGPVTVQTKTVIDGEPYYKIFENAIDVKTRECLE